MKPKNGKRTSKTGGWQLLIFFFWALCPLSGCKPVISLGRNPAGDDLKRIERLANYKDGEFQNLVQPAPVAPRRKVKWTGLIKNLLTKPASAKPARPLPYMLTDLRRVDSTRPVITWFGHSTFLVKTKSATILIDPSFSGYAGPFRGLITAFAGSNEYRLKDFPPIDILLISHDHYDHLDYTTVKKLKKKVKMVIVPIGVGSHLRYWGFDPNTVKELQWEEAVRVSNSLRIIATPAHHRSNRTFAQRKTLWASYVIEADGYKIYFSGDTGFSPHFKQIGEQHGPFDVAIIECGQYNTKWPQSHLFPWQTARASKDLKAKLVIPAHWAKFAESTHPWNEPVKKLLSSADSLQIPVFTPYIGQPYSIGQPVEKQEWWNFE